MSVIADVLIQMPLIILVWLPIGVYCYCLYINSYWKRKKIPFLPAKPIVGNLFDMFRFRKCAVEIFADMYNERRAIGKPFVGIHFFHKPTLLIRDPELIKQLLVKDFGSFSDRYASSDIHSDVMGSTNLFFVPNPAWKVIRSRMTPFFSGGKLKKMFYLMKNIGGEMNDTLLSFGVKKKTKSFSVDIKDFFARYTTDVIGSCAFGIEANSLANPESDFIKNGKRIFHFDWYRALEACCIMFIPQVVQFFKFKVFSRKSTHFLRNTMNDIIAERELSGLVRHDLIDTLIDLKKEDMSKRFSTTNVVFQGDVIVAQAALFFSAGYETSSAAMSFGLYELAFQPDLQTKLREEIKEILLTSNGELTYDNLHEMVYLSMVVQECIRMYPPVGFLDRKCTKKDGYSLAPYDNFVIPHNMPITIPVFAIHRDPKYWHNPTKFDPERFSAENKDKIVPYTYLAMGAGPHSCIGERFSILQMKIGIVDFFKNHRVTPAENTPRVFEFEPKALTMQAKGGLVLNIVRDPLF